MLVHEAFARALREHDVDTIFGVMGDGNLHYLANFRDAGARFIGATHDGGGVGMADAYARVCGKLGVASVTHGPALTNTLTQLTEAVRARTPLLLITGSAPPEPTHFQRIDIAAVAHAAGAGHERVYRPDTVVRDINRAVRRAITERRPIVLDLPAALLQTTAADQTPVKIPATPKTVTPAIDEIDDALGMIVSADRPIILAGRGAVLSGARDALILLSATLGAPLATTVLANEFFGGEPNTIGVYGSLSSPVASEIIAAADCVVAFGASLNMYTTAAGDTVRNKSVVHIDSDPSAFGQYWQADHEIVGDAADAAGLIDHTLRKVDHQAADAWNKQATARLRDAAQANTIVDASTTDTIDIRVAAQRLDEMLPADRTLVTDVGRFLAGAWPYIRPGDPRRFVSTIAFGSIGLGIAAAIGSTIAAPSHPTVAISGDGGFMMNVGELATAIREKIPVVFVVFNDGAYGAEHYKLVALGIGLDPVWWTQGQAACAV